MKHNQCNYSHFILQLFLMVKHIPTVCVCEAGVGMECAHIQVN